MVVPRPSLKELVVRLVTLIASVVLTIVGFSVIGYGVAQAPAERPLSVPAFASVSLRALPTLLGALSAPPPAKATAPTAKAPAEDTTKAAVDPNKTAKAAAPAKANPAPAPVAAAPAGEGTMTLQASDTADVYLDGKKLGSSPQTVKSKAGTHRVRFDCYDAAGNTVTGAVKTVTLAADQELEVPFQCPDAQ
jgi:PEGA domain